MAKTPAPAAPQTPEPPRRGLSIPKWLWDAEKRPDHSREGFEAAFKAAIEFCAGYEWRSIEAMQDELLLVMSERLRHGDIECDFIAVNYMTGRPRVVVRAGRNVAREDIAVKIGPGKGKAN